MELSAGLSGLAQLTVTEADTAQALGSGEVGVLGTPRVVALAEAATVAATASHLDPGHTTVGTRIELDHLAPTAPGRTVVAEATLVNVDGRQLTFRVQVRDGDTVVASGAVERVLVDKDRFTRRALGG